MNYGFVNRITVSDGTGIPGGVGGGASYQRHMVFYVGVPDVEAARARAEAACPETFPVLSLSRGNSSRIVI